MKSKEQRREEYAEKIEAKKERYENAADKAASEAQAQYDRAGAVVDRIPMGQPILVGHHSEKRHRRDLARRDAAMDKSFEAQKKAEHYARKAESVGKAGISSDDPDAVEKLEAKLAKMEEERTYIKAVNKLLRAKKKTDEEKIAGLIELGADPAEAPKALKPDRFGDVGFPKYRLTNLGGNIRRVKQRIEQLKAAASAPPVEDIEGDGFRIEEDQDDNRLRIYFDERLSKEHFKLSKSLGFVYSRRNEAFQRQISNGARYNAKSLVRQVLGIELGESC